MAEHLLNDGQGDALVQGNGGAECRMVWVPSVGDASLGQDG